MKLINVIKMCYSKLYFIFAIFEFYKFLGELCMDLALQELYFKLIKLENLKLMYFTQNSYFEQIP